MADQGTGKQARVGIVGGGKAGCELLDIFAQSTQARVEYVVDVNPDAPGIKAARRARIATFTDVAAALAATPVDVVFEITGSARVGAMLAERLAGTSTRLVTSDIAFLILTTIREHTARERETVVAEIAGIRRDIVSSLAGTDRLIGDVGKVTSDMNLLAINARIEAARVGEAGKGFAVVAEEMQRSSEFVRQVTGQIQQVNAGIRAVSDHIEGALQRLR